MLNQTKLVPVNVRLDLLLIRLASMNQILDPWVYILLRREVVWKFVSTVKRPFIYLFCKNQSEEDQLQDDELFARQRTLSGPSLNSGENATCFWFCWHCMCDQPQKARSFSVMSTMVYEYNRRTTICRSKNPVTTTTVLAKTIADNVIIPETIAPIGDEDTTERSQAKEKLKKQASADTNVIVKQPQKETRVKLYTNGLRFLSKSDSHLYQTLLNSDCDIVVKNGEV